MKTPNNTRKILITYGNNEVRIQYELGKGWRCIFEDTREDVLDQAIFKSREEAFAMVTEYIDLMQEGA